MLFSWSLTDQVPDLKLSMCVCVCVCVCVCGGRWGVLQPVACLRFIQLILWRGGDTLPRPPHTFIKHFLSHTHTHVKHVRVCVCVCVCVSVREREKGNLNDGTNRNAANCREMRAL